MPTILEKFEKQFDKLDLPQMIGVRKLLDEKISNEIEKKKQYHEQEVETLNEVKKQLFNENDY